jgi:hypothetical protein
MSAGKILAVILLAASLAFGQAITAIPITMNASGNPATQLVTICATNPGSGTCGSLVTTYTDKTLGQACIGSGAALSGQPAWLPAGTACSNPGYSDATGNILAFAAAGTYWCQIGNPGTVKNSIPCPASGSGGGGGTITGSGIANTLTMWTGASAIGNSSESEAAGILNIATTGGWKTTGTGPSLWSGTISPGTSVTVPGFADFSCFEGSDALFHCQTSGAANALGFSAIGGAVDLTSQVTNILPAANGGVTPPSTNGDVPCATTSGTVWGILSGNTSGTKVLQEDASGNCSWVANGSGPIYGLKIGATALTAGDTVTLNNTTPVASSNGLNVQWQTSKSGSTDSVSAEVVGDGNSGHALLGNGTFGPISSLTGQLPGSYTFYIQNTITGSVSSGTFTLGEQAVQATTGAIGNLANAPTSSTSLILGPIQGTPDSTHNWVGQTSTAVYAPSALPTYAISAQNNVTGAIDYSGTDATVVVNDAITNISSTCGTLFFKTGVYNFNSLIQESTGGFGQYYMIGFPASITTGQYCTWTLRGDSWTPIEGQFSTGTQNGGVILQLTSTGRGTVSSTTKITDVWARPDVTHSVGASVFMEDLDLRTYDNQRGCETQSDMSQALNANYINMNTDTTVAPGSLAFPVQASCVSWGGSDPGGLIGITTENSSKQITYINNFNSWGADVGIDVRGEHSVLINADADFGNHGIDIGVRGGNMGYGPTIINSGCGEVARCLTLGSSISSGIDFEISSLNIEDATASIGTPFVPVYHALESHPGYAFGNITYVINQAGVGAVVPAIPLFDGGGGQNLNITGRGILPFIPSSVTDPFTRANAATLGGAWLSFNGAAVGITTNKAAFQLTNSQNGGQTYTGKNFNTDQFSKITVSALNASSTAYAQANTNEQGTSTSNQEYQYFCSGTAGAGLYGIGQHIATVETVLVSTASAACPSVPFTMELRYQGGTSSTAGLLCAYLNGAPDPNLSPNCIKPTGTLLTGGGPSFSMAQSATNGTQLSNFVGGSLPAFHGTDSIYGQPGGWLAPQYFAVPINTGNCSSAASPAVCAGAVAGSVALPTGTNPTLVVNTTAVTANSQIFLTVDESLGTKLSVTCNTTLSTLLNPVVTARTAATSFTFTIGAIIATNPACVSYYIVN